MVLAHVTQYLSNRSIAGAESHPPISAIVTKSPLLTRRIAEREYPALMADVVWLLKQQNPSITPSDIEGLQLTYEVPSSIAAMDGHTPKSYGWSFEQFLKVFDRSIGDGEYIYALGEGGKNSCTVYTLADRIKIGNATGHRNHYRI